MTQIPLKSPSPNTITLIIMVSTDKFGKKADYRLFLRVNSPATPPYWEDYMTKNCTQSLETLGGHMS